MQQQNSAVARLNYNTARDILQAAKMDPDKEIITQSFIRTENKLVLGKTSYKFALIAAIQNEQGTINNTERRLNTSDSFIVSSMGVFLSKLASDVDGSAPLHTYPNALVFVTGSAALETIYNSVLDLSVNNKTILPAWDLARHRKVPVSQITATLLDQFDGGEDGFFPVEPNLVFIGNKNYILTVTLPAALAAVDAFTRLVIVFRGLLVQDSSSTA